MELLGSDSTFIGFYFCMNVYTIPRLVCNNVSIYTGLSHTMMRDTARTNMEMVWVQNVFDLVLHVIHFWA